MIDGFLFVLTLVTAIACGLVAGFFFAFSTTVMKALARLQGTQGMDAMRSINVVVINPLVMTALFGTALACVVLVVAAFVEWGEAYAVSLLVGGLLYLAGVVVVTIAYHVPRNDALAAADPAEAAAASQWARFVRTWTAWNHLRTLAPLGTASLFTIALRVS